MAPRKLILFSHFVTIIFFSGCLEPPTATPLPTLQTVQVAITPSLDPLAEALHACALNQPDIALTLSPTSSQFLDPREADLSLWFGPPPSTAGFAAPLATEDIVIIIHPENSITSLSTPTLKKIFLGSIYNWEEVGGVNKTIQTWVLPQENEFSQIFRQNILDGETFSSLALVAPDPQAMLEAVSQDPDTIGFLPRAWLDESVKTLRLELGTANDLRGPILALAAAEPSGNVRNFLGCLQSGAGQETILQRYGDWTMDDGRPETGDRKRRVGVGTGQSGRDSKVDFELAD